MKRSFAVSIVFLLILSTPSIVFAHHRAKILGASTSTPSLSPTVEGPGLILPDSPLFFLDKLKQNVRLFFAFTPQAKAKVFSDIASERMAELNFMLAKQDQKGIDIALTGVSENLKNAAGEIEKAQLSGKDVSQIAKQVNNTIKTKQEGLDLLEAQTTGELQAKVSAVNEGVLESKVTVEDGLPEDELQKEIKSDLERSITKNLQEASSAAKGIESDLEELQNQEKEAGQNALKRRQEALQKAIEQKNEELKKDQERLLEFEKKKNDELLKLETDEAKSVKETVEKAKEAATAFSNARREVEKVKTRQEGSTGSSNTSSSSNSSGSSTSGSSGSGSSESSKSGGSNTSGSSGSGKSGKD